MVCLDSKVPNKQRLPRPEKRIQKVKSSLNSLFQKVSITPDLSVQERALQKQLKTELKGRKENGQKT